MRYFLVVAFCGLSAGCAWDKSPTPLHSEIRMDRAAAENARVREQAGRNHEEVNREFETNTLSGVAAPALATGAASSPGGSISGATSSTATVGGTASGAGTTTGTGTLPGTSVTSSGVGVGLNTNTLRVRTITLPAVTNNPGVTP
jgi:hypothetical protein